MEKIENYSWLYKFAWGYEILAAIIGIAMAFVFNAQAYTNAQIDGNIDVAEFTGLMAGTLPFLMVAAAELCKIPLVTVVMRARLFFWKVLFTVVLFFATLITFETVSTGLESANALRSKPLTELNQSIVAKQRDIKILQNDTKKAVNLGAEKKRKKINDDYDKRVETIDAEIKRIEKKHNYLLQSKVQPLQNQVNIIKEQQSNKRKSRVNKISIAQKAVNNANKRISKANIVFSQCTIFCDKEKENIRTAELALENSEKKLNSAQNIYIDGDNEIKKIQQQITHIENDIGLKNDKELIVSNKKHADADNWLKKSMSDISKKYQNEIKIISSEKTQIRSIQSSINDIRRQKALAVNDNLVYRLAGKFYGKNASDVTESDAAFVGNLIAITIGLLVAIIGPFIAIAYLVLTNQHETSRSIFRNLASAILTKKRKPTIKIKKVEVENIVIKEKEIVVERIKEVPVEKIVIKHVPIYTDDKTLLQLTNEYIERDST